MCVIVMYKNKFGKCLSDYLETVILVLIACESIQINQERMETQHRTEKSHQSPLLRLFFSPQKCLVSSYFVDNLVSQLKVMPRWTQLSAGQQRTKHAAQIK